MLMLLTSMPISSSGRVARKAGSTVTLTTSPGGAYKPVDTIKGDPGEEKRNS